MLSLRLCFWYWSFDLRRALVVLGVGGTLVLGEDVEVVVFLRVLDDRVRGELGVLEATVDGGVSNLKDL